MFDFFSEGQRIVTVGAVLERPGQGHVYSGIHLLHGAIDSTVLQLAYSYRLSPKWVSTFSSAIDLGEGGNIGQSFWITRIGESLLVSLGANVDASRGSWGVGISVEPRFLGRGRIAQLGGARITPGRCVWSGMKGAVSLLPGASGGLKQVGRVRRKWGWVSPKEMGKGERSGMRPAVYLP